MSTDSQPDTTRSAIPQTVAQCKGGIVMRSGMQVLWTKTGDEGRWQDNKEQETVNGSCSRNCTPPVRLSVSRRAFLHGVGCGLCAVIGGVTIAHAKDGDVWPLGELLNGHWGAGREPVLYIAIEFQGAFTAENINRAFEIARKSQMQPEKTAAIRGTQYARLASDRHAVFGWVNLERKHAGYVGIKIEGRTSYRWVLNDRSTGTSNDWKDFKWSTNDHEIGIRIADDDRNGVAWVFYEPK